MSKPNRHVPTLKEATLAAFEWYRSPEYPTDRGEDDMPSEIVDFLLGHDGALLLMTFGGSILHSTEVVRSTTHEQHEGHVTLSQLPKGLPDFIERLVEMAKYYDAARHEFETYEGDLNEASSYSVFWDCLYSVLRGGGIRVFFCRQCLKTLQGHAVKTAA